MRFDGLKCPYCGYLPEMILASQGEMYENIAGRICPKCEEYIPPVKKIAEVERNRLKKEHLKQKCLEQIRKQMEKRNGNQFR